MRRMAGCLMVWRSTGRRSVLTLCPAEQEGRRFVTCSVHTKHCTKSILSRSTEKMDLPFHNRLAYNRVHRKVPALLP